MGEPLGAVVINEFRANSVPPDEDFVELYNASNAPVDLSGAWLSDDPATNKFRIPDGTWIPGRGFRKFDENQLGFRLDAAGETIFLVNAATSSRKSQASCVQPLVAAFG